MMESRKDPAPIAPEVLVHMYKEMVRFRRFEEAAARAYGMGKIHGFCHLHIGQEAIASAIGSALHKEDLLIGAYRTHTLALARGMSDQSAMDELFGKATGCSGGMGGSMHFFDVENGFYGGWGLVGQQVPTGAGLAFAQKYRQTGGATLCLLGDGAVHQGAIHETLNLAAVWSLPLVLLIENNYYGMGTAVDRISSLPPLHELGAAYKIRHYDFNGMDAIESYHAIGEAMREARENNKPALIEARCSRFRGHSMSDPGKYRTKEQLEEEKGRDPIPGLGQLLVERGLLTEDAIRAIDEEQKSAMKRVVENAEAAPWPTEDALYKHVLADSTR